MGRPERTTTPRTAAKDAVGAGLLSPETLRFATKHTYEGETCFKLSRAQWLRSAAACGS